ncbi:LytR/AlgR family response regulator transcription factor [Mucilaginibacter pedocola]|uniref:DNA-binding response regulator n=1 Tax=Mucilaginibacter pedocola TaxID=1792845 RepID=A0A1S9P7Q5_9SPHI|nr:LytTR family DNA-binding domain-containing protein [Mucilaginibacter pedocola]OOQ56976.1 DNA-binding response regulator [Mucilaginibacter pedocola]
MNCIAVDDEPLALALLADNISKIPFLNLVATCNDALEASQILQQNDIDLLFMDIQMPAMSGLQFIGTLTKRPLVIIVSAYKQYALESFELDVIDYLHKPVPLDRFMKACNKANELYELRAQQSQPSKYTFLNVGYTLLKVVFDEVLYIEGLKDYAKIYFTNSDKTAVVRLSFKSIEEQWPSEFLRVHKSFIINSKQISAVKKSSILVAENELPLSETYRHTINNFIALNSR